MCRVIEEMRIQEREEGRQEGRQEGLQEGLQKGRQEIRQETAANMLRAGKYAPEEIAGVSGLSLDEVEELRAKLNI